MYKVLFVDDEPHIIEGLKIMLDWAAHGFRICGEASNGEDALKIVRSSNPDLIITDIKMPGMNGLELIRRVGDELHSRAKFVILSGYDEFAFVQKAMLYRVTDYLLKPLDDTELGEVVSKLATQIRDERKKEEDTTRKLCFIANQSIRRIIKGEKKASLTSRAGILLNLGQQEEVRCLLFETAAHRSPAKADNEAGTREKRNHTRQMLAEALGPEFQLHLFEDEENRLGIMASEKMPFYPSLESFALSLISQLKESTGDSVSASVSAPLKGPDALYEVYRQGRFALGFRFFRGDGCFVRYEAVKDVDLDSEFYMENNHSLLESIQSNRTDEIQQKVRQLFDEFHKKLKTLESIRMYIWNFELGVVRLWAELHGDAEEFLQQAVEFNKTLERLTITSLQDSFLELCLQIAAGMEVLRQGNPMEITDKVRDYIRHNYSRDIKLKNIARELYINPVYLGQLFKKATGMQFNEYLHAVRVQEAKKLLKITGMKISDIARTVGYNEPKYFIQKFKSVTQMSPSAYKNMK